MLYLVFQCIGDEDILIKIFDSYSDARHFCFNELKCSCKEIKAYQKVGNEYVFSHKV